MFTLHSNQTVVQRRTGIPKVHWETTLTTLSLLLLASTKQVWNLCEQGTLEDWLCSTRDCWLSVGIMEHCNNL